MNTGFVRPLCGLALFGFVVAVDAAPLKVGVVLDKGGRDDKSFNAMAFKGAKEAEKKFGLQLKVIEAADDTSIEPALRTFAQQGYPLVIGIGFVQASAIKSVAPAFPKTHFLLVDAEVDAQNVRAIVFQEHEGSFLVGAVAALTSTAKTFGFIGGMDIPLIRRFELGYKAGVQHIKKDAKILSNYVGATSDAWKNPTKAKELALAQYQAGADIIYHAAGASGLGVFDAAEEKKKFVIGVDSNQNWVKPGRVLTSMVKRVDLAVYDTIQTETQGAFKGGIEHWGLAKGAVDFAVDEHNQALLSQATLDKVNELKKQIVDGKLSVPDYYKTAKK
jgi:basic membrane protein A